MSALKGHSGDASDLVDIEGYLARHEQKTLVRFALVGSVDDGKSTLIGRLLHDTHGIYEDQLASVQKASAQRGDTSGEIDFSLFTDGLKAEREQGITIDVAYRYFSTETRKFIIADTPGHEQYTRNMATGASTADIAIILLDARLGVLKQSRRHATIASLLGIGRLIVAVNKMDLVDYAQDRYLELVQSFSEVSGRLRFDGVHFVPVSAKKGDNVVTRSEAMPWHEGETLLGLLDSLPLRRLDRAVDPLRFAVQTVLRPNLDYRGFAGNIARGTVRPGDLVKVLPSGRTTRVSSIDFFGASLSHASAPLSVTLRTVDEVDVSRGDLIAAADNAPVVSTDVEATVVWLSERSYDPTRKLLLKHTSRWVPARVSTVLGSLELDRGELVSKGQALELNDIARVRLHLARPIFCDPYAECRATGAFILVDALENATVAAGMVESAREAAARRGDGRPSALERAERLGHRAAFVWLAGETTRVERALFERGISAIRVSGDHLSAAVIGALLEAGMCVLSDELDEAGFLAHAEGLPPDQSLDLHLSPGDPVEHIARALALPEALAGGGGI